MMVKEKLITISVVALLPVSYAHAFGLGDIVNIGIQAGGEIVRAAGGKAVDAIKDSMRDPEAEAREKAERERKLAEQMQKQIDEIEAIPNLRPIDRERLVLQLHQTWQASKDMQVLVERAEVQQKAERDKVLTMGGVASAIGKSALNTPSVALSQADVMSKNPIWRTEQRMRNEAVFQQAQVQVDSGIPQAKAKVTLAQADTLRSSGVQQAGSNEVIAKVEDIAKAERVAINVGAAVQVLPPSQEADSASKAKLESGNDITVNAEPIVSALATAEANAFSPDLGKRVWIEFEDAPTETVRLRKLLQERGHTVVPTKGEAEVVYLIQGEFVISETKMHDGLTISAGKLLENPEQPIDPPSGKTMGTINAGLVRFLLAAAGAKAPVSEAAGYRQSMLLVIARQPISGKETRVSVVKKVNSETIEAAKLARVAREELYRILGI